MYRYLRVIFVLVSVPFFASAEPYTFTSSDYIEYGIYFSAHGASTYSSGKLLTLRYGDIDGWYTRYFPTLKNIPRPTQRLRLITSRGAVRVDRNENSGVTVTRDTHDAIRRTGTKSLHIRFEAGTCTDATGITSPCVVDLSLTTKAPDKGTVRQSRILTITTSTGLSFRYRSARRDGSKPLNLPLLRRTPAINNYAWEWRPGLS
jgi:hypothetical protein